MTERAPEDTDADDASHEELAEEERERAVPADVSEADALDQATSAVPEHERSTPHIAADVPEADALDQARDVEEPDEYDR